MTPNIILRDYNCDIVDSFRCFKYQDKIRTNQTYNFCADRHSILKKVHDGTIEQIRVYQRSSILTVTAKLDDNREIGLCWLERIDRSEP